MKRGISMPSIKKRTRQNMLISEQNVILDPIDKVFATNHCIWCDRPFDKYRITCPYCRNCQWCGMVAFNDNNCQNCGNHTDEEIKHDYEQRKTVNF